jgi:hypothetical protein
VVLVRCEMKLYRMKPRKRKNLWEHLEESWAVDAEDYERSRRGS